VEDELVLPVDDLSLLLVEDFDCCDCVWLDGSLLLLLWPPAANAGAANNIAPARIPVSFFMRGSFRSHRRKVGG
jgi:hypothetical protein